MIHFGVHHQLLSQSYNTNTSIYINFQKPSLSITSLARPLTSFNSCLIQPSSVYFVTHVCVCLNMSSSVCAVCVWNDSDCAICQNYIFSGESNTPPFFRRLQQIWKIESITVAQPTGIPDSHYPRVLTSHEWFSPASTACADAGGRRVVVSYIYVRIWEDLII